MRLVACNGFLLLCLANTWCLADILPTSVLEADESLTAMLDADLLELRLVLDSAAPLYQRAPLTLAVEVATRDVFSRGTRVRDFRIEGAVTRPVSKFANNSTRRENGNSWSVQRWRFRVYPRRDGDLELPVFRVFVSIKTESSDIREGEIQITGEPLSVVSPSGLPPDSALGDWVAAPSLTINESWDSDIERYVPGDAVTRTRRLVAKDTPGMLLPSALPIDMPGLSLYPVPAKIRDESNRGSLTGVRVEELIVTFEKPGEYIVPGARYDWFNTQSQRFESIVLKDRRFVVIASADASDAVSGQTAPEEPSFDLRAPVLSALAVLLGVALLYRLRRHPFISAPLELATRHRLRRRAHSRFRACMANGDSPGALRVLHQQLCRDTAFTSFFEALPPQHPQRAILRQLLAHAYGSGARAPSSAEAQALYTSLLSRRHRKNLSRSGELDSIALNPGSP